MDVHEISLKELYSTLSTSEKGLTTLEVEKRLIEHGFNHFEKKRHGLLILKFFKQFTNFFAILLITASFLAYLAEKIAPNQGNLYISIALLLVVVLNAIFTFIQEYRSEKIMETFKKMLPQFADVLRDNQRQKILASLLVPGDIIYLNEGDKVPADARLIEANQIKVDHSSITGESEPQLRSLESTHHNILETRNVVFSSSLVQSGDGKAIVYATGKQTQIGKIASLTKSTSNVQTPLHREINRFIKIITILAVAVGIIFFIVGYLIGEQLLSSLIFGIGIIVANVPEGLMPTVTLALSIASRKMAKRNALIKDLESVETLGSTTIICTDKTGTLTENKMAISSIALDFTIYPLIKEKIKQDLNFPFLLKTMTLCNNAHLDKEKNIFIGDPTETALLNFASTITNLPQDLRLQEIPFDSKSKRMITLNKSGNKKIAYMKGAPEVIVDKCTTLLIQGRIQKLTPQKKTLLIKQYQDLAKEGQRVLAFAFQENNSSTISEENFTFIGLVGMVDPIRKEVPEAILKCHSAGIKVIMITGDHSLTAEAVAKKVGILKPGKVIILTGDELDTLDEITLQKNLKEDNIIFARTNPMHKLRIVRALQAMGEVVTVTGDGVNDAPALKHADMGVAMGVEGTEVAREASDMILMDDNFASIVNAVEEGRTIFENIRKFLNYILAHLTPEIIPFIVFALFNIPLAITIILILAIDLGTEMLPAIALGSEKPESDVMKQKPIPRTEPLLNRKMLLGSYLCIGMISTIGGFSAFFYILLSGGWHFGESLSTAAPLYLKAVTAFFASIVISQIGNVLARKTNRQSLFESGLFNNKLIWVGIIVELFILLLIVYLPQTHSFFGTQPLSLFELLLGVPFAILIILFEEIRKYFVRQKIPFVEKYLAW